MKRYLAFLLILLIGSAKADAPPMMQDEAAIAQHRLFYYPTPEYPYEARRDKVTGSGVFELRFDYETGHLCEFTLSLELDGPIWTRRRSAR